MSRLYPFADDSMMGREAGTLGNYKGTEYLAAEARRLGLVPAGENGTYFQTLPYKRRTTDSASTVRVGGVTLAHGTDFFGTGFNSVRLTGAPVVFGGTLGDSTRMLSPTRRPARSWSTRCRCRPWRSGACAAPRPRPTPPPSCSRGSTSSSRCCAARPRARSSTTRRAWATPARAAGAVRHARRRGALLRRAARRPRRRRRRPAGRPRRAHHPRARAHPARNVVAVLPGSDPALAAQYVAVGAHNDHVARPPPVDHDSLRLFNRVVRPQGAEDEGKRATPEQQARVNADLAAWRAAHPNSARIDSIFNGADDDASGSMTVLEVAEKLGAMKTKPKRSVLFVWHTGEEKGLLGSEWFTDHPTVPRDSIVAQLNMDMVGRGAAGDVADHGKSGEALRGGPDYVQLVGSRRLSTELGDLVEAVNRDGKYGLRFDYAMDANGHPQNIYCRSDHYSYARYGIPIVFFSTGGHSDYHQVTDEPQYIDYPHLAKVGNLVADAAVRVANLDHRVAVDKPKPDPKGSCQQ
jgi:hypothetical protein